MEGMELEGKEGRKRRQGRKGRPTNKQTQKDKQTNAQHLYAVRRVGLA